MLPTDATLRLSSGGCNGEQRNDDSLYCPRFVRPNPAGALMGLGGGSQTIAPGAYDYLQTGDGAVIELERGGSYFFNRVQLGRNNTVNLIGTGEVVIYTHHFEVGDNSSVNMPTPGSAPIPKDLQICMTPQPDCEVTECKLSINTQGAFVVAGTNVELNLMNNAQLFGAAIVHRVNLYNGSAVHFDEALLGKPMAGQPQWALVAQGR